MSTGEVPGGGRPTQVVLVRHGQTQWSLDGRHTGRTDLALTEEGREEARALAPLLAVHDFARVLSSPLQRARETAVLAGMDEESTELLDDCHEWDYGDYEGMTTAQIRSARPGWDLWKDGCPGGEHASDVGKRVDRVISLARDTVGEVAVFAHGHVLRVLAARWVGLPPGDGKALALSTASVSFLGYERENSVVSEWNRTAPISPA